MTDQLINVIPNTMIDDYFFFGFVGGIVGYLYYLLATREMPNHKTHVGIAIYGVIVSGLLGGLLAIVFDRSIELAIIVGLLNQVMFLTIVKAVAAGEFWVVIKEILIKLLTGGIGGKP